MSEWTPGPWQVEGVHGGFEIVDAPGLSTMAWVATAPDARLIAAAPEMAEELEALVQRCDNCSGTGSIATLVDCSWCIDARALLDRIGGK